MDDEHLVRVQPSRLSQRSRTPKSRDSVYQRKEYGRGDWLSPAAHLQEFTFHLGDAKSAKLQAEGTG